MKRFTLIFLFSLSVLFSFSPAFGQISLVGNQISFQGRLEQSGKAANGQFNMDFFIKTWSERQTVNVKNGNYTVTLGSVKPIPNEIFTENKSLELYIYVNGQKLEPTIPIIPVPFSYKALSVEKGSVGKDEIRDKSVEAKHLADDAISSSVIKTGVITSSHIENQSITTEDLKPATQNGLLYTTPQQEVIWLSFTSASLMFNSVSQPPLETGKIWIGSSQQVPVAQTLSGDITMNMVGFTTIGAGTITNTKIASNAVTTDKIQDYSLLPNDFATTTGGQVLVTNNFGQVQWQNQTIFATTTGVGTDKILTTNPLGSVVWEDKSAFVSSGGGNFVNVNGTVPLTANWNIGNFQLNNVAQPLNLQDATNKQYVDNGFTSISGSVQSSFSSVSTYVDNGFTSVATYTSSTQNGFVSVGTYVDNGFTSVGTYVDNGFTSVATYTTQSIVQHGNAFGTAMRIGTNDLSPLIFETNDTQHMVIDGLGRVGIGIAPQSEFHVDKLTGNTTVRITGAVGDGQGVQMGVNSFGYFMGRTASNKFSLNTESPLGNALSAILTYDPSTQALGIKNNSPSSAVLDVGGNAYINGFLTVNGGIGLGYDAGGSNGMLRFNTAGYYEGFAGGVWNPFVTGGAFTSAILQGGNAFGAPVEIGSTDLQPLVLRSGTNFITITNKGTLSLNGNGSITNVFIGNLAGNSVTSGTNNIFIGNQAGKSVTLGGQNVIIGNLAGQNIVSSSNILIGAGAGFSKTSGGNNVFLGRDAGFANQTGMDNLFLGFNAGYNEITSNKLYIENSNSNFPLIFGDFATDFASVNGSFAIGYSPSAPVGDGMLAFNTGGFYGHFGGVWNKFMTVGSGTAGNILQGGNAFGTATAIGTKDNQPLFLVANSQQAGRIDINIGGSNNDGNTYYGYRTGVSNTTGFQNTFIGFEAGKSHTTGWDNVFLGTRSGQANTTGGWNVFLGSASGEQSTTGSNNTMVGMWAGRLNGAGNDNTYVGSNAGRQNSTGSGNVFLGNYAGVNEMGSNKLYIANSSTANPLIWGDFQKQYAKINGNLVITNSPFATAEAGMLRYNAGSFEGHNGTVWSKFAQTNNFYQDANNLFIGNRTVASGANNTFLGVAAGNITTTGLDNTLIGFEAGLTNNGSYNTFLGSLSGRENTTATGNTAVGVNALQTNQLGVNNVAMGYQAMMNGGNNKSDNVAIGFQAGVSTQSSFNVALGSKAAQNNTAGGDFVAIGFQAGLNYATLANSVIIGTNAAAGNGTTAVANDNVIIGKEAGFKNTDGSYNTFLGRMAGHENTTANNNTFVGYNAGYNNNNTGVAGVDNTFIGSLAGSGNTTGFNNVFIGKSAGSGNTTGQDNIFIGKDAGLVNGAANRQLAIGWAAGSKNNVGSNIFIGWWAGESNTTGSSSIAIGNEAGRFNVGANNVFIGHGAGRVDDGSSTLFAGSGNVFIGANVGNSNIALRNASNTLAIDNSDTATPLIFGNFATDQVTINGSLRVTTLTAALVNSDGTGLLSGSDIRFKKNFTPLKNSLANVLKLNGFNFFWRMDEFKDRFFTDEKQIGFIAQDLEQVYPEVVKTLPDGYKAVDYSKLTPILVEAIKEQQAQIEELKAKNSRLEKQSTEKTAALEAKLDKLQTQMQLLLEQLSKTNAENGKK